MCSAAPVPCLPRIKERDRRHSKYSNQDVSLMKSQLCMQMTSRGQDESSPRPNFNFSAEGNTDSANNIRAMRTPNKGRLPENNSGTRAALRNDAGTLADQCDCLHNDLSGVNRWCFVTLLPAAAAAAAAAIGHRTRSLTPNNLFLPTACQGGRHTRANPGWKCTCHVTCDLWVVSCVRVQQHGDTCKSKQ
ncbi:hypothetical protein E2C01_006571 [Portunus trituberculatus]|uniref:Uncharacterized protein n=1 Tax=Portunus trituberculatus TaxID=210409 RepID=A0A5B7D264_PORTR|nr:hypothetical protein [Portunus trituberculatus]